MKRFHDVNRPSPARGLMVATLTTLLMPLLASANTNPAFAQAGKASASSPTRTGFNKKRDVSRPLRDLVRVFKKGPPAPPREIPNRIRKRGPGAPAPLAADPLLRSFMPIGAMPSPIITFEGGSDDDNENIVGFRLAPPDNNGDVGPNHYAQFINLILTIYDKTTGTPVLGPAPGNFLWADFGGPCEFNNDGDPIVVYDQFTGRWLFSQFEYNSGDQCFAVSQTSDPTGAYYRYEFHVSDGFNDYPKISVWSDGYSMMFHEFNPDFVGTQVLSFEKDKMIEGLPAQFVEFFQPPVDDHYYYTIQPAHIEGLTPPPIGTPAYFVMADDDEDNCGAPCVPDPAHDFYEIWQLHSDWLVPNNSTWVGPVPVPTAEFDDNMCNYLRACIPQPSPSDPVDSLSSFTMYRSVYRNFGDHESLYTVHTVDVGGDHAGIRWAEIRSPGTVPAVYDTGTFAPDANHRWMPSIGADHNGNIAIGYSVASSSLFPSIRYAGRLAADPPGEMAQGETDMMVGTGSQQSSANRWGDYTAMSIDEIDDCTFWYTSQYMQTTSGWNWHTRIGSFKFPSCTSGPTGTLTGTVVSSPDGVPIAGAHIVVGGTYQTLTATSGEYSIVLPTGTYDVTASKCGFESQTAVSVVINDGQTTPKDFALAGGASTYLQISVPPNVVQESPFTATVTVRDASNNVVTSYCGTIHFTSSDPLALLPADYTFTTNDTGTHTFTDQLAFETAGPQSTTATDTVSSLTGTGNTTVQCPATAVTAANNGPICAGATLNLTATLVTAATYSWTGPNGFVSTAPNPSIPSAQPGASGTYVVTVDKFGCIYSASTMATVNPIPATPTASNSGPYCSGQTVQLFATAISGATYHWSGPNGFTSTLQNPTIPAAGPEASGVYLVTAMANGCLSVPGSTNVSVYGGFFPAITTSRSVVVGAIGVLASVVPHSGSSYNWTLSGGTITDGQGTGSIHYSAGSPGTRMTLSVVETTAAGCISLTGSKRVMVDFADVPPSHPFHNFVITLALDGITGGCGGGNYCPDDNTLRSQMAIFLLRGTYGQAYAPPPATGTVFADVPLGSFADAFIEELYAQGITGGCATNPLRYCPGDSVLRSQMAIFLLKAKHGSTYVPPPASGIFADVPPGAFAAAWIEQLYVEGVTGGCAVDPLRYCPTQPTTRGAMAVFLTRTFTLP